MTSSRVSPGIIDIATNLTDCVFRGISWGGKKTHDDDFSAMLQRAAVAGVHRIIITGTSLEQSARAIHLCQQHRGLLFCTVGVHPAHAAEFLRPVEPSWNKRLDSVTISPPDEFVAPEAFKKDGTFFTLNEEIIATRRMLLQELVENNRDVVVGYGEIGLDYAELKYCPAEVQKVFFVKQLELAATLGLPLVLHSRDCGMEFAEMLQAHAPLLKNRGVVHSFTGGSEELKAVLSLGLSVGLNGSALRTRALAEAVLPVLPLERTMVESDAPWCDIRPDHYGHGFVRTNFPTTKRGKPFKAGHCIERRVEPCHVRQVLEAVCGARREILASGETDDAVEAIVLQNSLAMFWPKEHLTAKVE
jgi:TatD DNase family protein